MNPMKLMKIKSSWEAFEQNHPKFPMFLDAVNKSAIQEDTVIEINVTTPEGKTLSSNIKLKQSDIDLFHDLSELSK